MPDASALEEFGLEVEHENHALVTNSGSSASTKTNNHQFASFSNRKQPTPSKEQRSLLASTNVKYRKLRINAAQRPGVLKWSFLVIIIAAIIVFFNIEQEEMIDESITPEDTEAKPDLNKFHLLRPKTKAHEDVAPIVVDDTKEEEGDIQPVFNEIE